jgi:hypothetical protein
MPTTASTPKSNNGLNYKLTVISVMPGMSENGPFLKIRATTPLKKKDTEITAMLFLNRGKKGEVMAPTAASQKAFDTFSGAKAGESIRAYGEVRPVKGQGEGSKESAYFVVRSLSAELPSKKGTPKAELAAA